MNYKIIRNEEQYELYLDRLAEIFDVDFSKNKQLEDEFDLLSILIDDYEKKNYPINPPSAIDYIKFIMEQRGITNKDMEQYLGSSSKVSEILNGKRKLSLQMIKRLHNNLGIPSDILLQDINSIEYNRNKLYGESIQKEISINQYIENVINHNKYIKIENKKIMYSTTTEEYFYNKNESDINCGHSSMTIN